MGDCSQVHDWWEALKEYEFHQVIGYAKRSEH